GVNHLAWVMGRTAGAPVGIGVARCIRDRADPELAEVAVVICDAWQQRGAGTVLLQTLAGRAWEAGIRRWNGWVLAANEGGRRVLAVVGTPRAERHVGHGVVEVTYDLEPSLFRHHVLPGGR